MADDRQTFEKYALYVMDLKRQEGLKFRTLERYEELLVRINQAIGHLKLADIRAQHLNQFYKNLGEMGVSDRGDKAKLAEGSEIPELLKSRKISRQKAGEAVGVSSTTISGLLNGKKIEAEAALKLAAFLDVPVKDNLVIESGKAVLSTKTILEYHRLIHTILATAEKELIVPYNAADKAAPPKQKKTDPNFFQPDMINAIIEALEEEPLKWQCITYIALTGGLRRGEIAGLKWDRVDFEHNTIKVDTTVLYSSKREEGDHVFEDTTKTDGSYRFVKLPAETMALLKQYRLEYLRNKMLLGEWYHDTGFLFTKENGEPMAPDNITSWMRKFSERHGLPHINPHAFRHTAASMLINNGVDVVTVSKRLGHAQTSTTENIYAHVIAEADARAAESIADSILRKKTNKTG